MITHERDALVIGRKRDGLLGLGPASFAPEGQVSPGDLRIDLPRLDERVLGFLHISYRCLRIGMARPGPKP